MRATSKHRVCSCRWGSLSAGVRFSEAVADFGALKQLQRSNGRNGQGGENRVHEPAMPHFFLGALVSGRLTRTAVDARSGVGNDR